MIKEPMLAAKITVDKLHQLDYPVLVTPKYDGVRALIVDGAPLSRTFKPIPNVTLHNLLVATGLNNVDGEIVIENEYLYDHFNETSALFRSNARDRFRVKYHIFDVFTYPQSGYLHRAINNLPWGYSGMDYMDSRHRWASLQLCLKKPCMVYSPKEVELALNIFLAEGHEGIIIRDQYGTYKQGRSTINEQLLIKLKPEDISIATITGFEQLVDIHGKCREKLGALRVVSPGFNPFKIGTGFTKDQRKCIWNNQLLFTSRQLYFSHAAGIEQDRPRFPVFKRFVS